MTVETKIFQNFDATLLASSEFSCQAVCGPFMAVARYKESDKTEFVWKDFLSDLSLDLLNNLLNHYIGYCYHAYFQKTDEQVETWMNDFLAFGHFESASCLLAFLQVRCRWIVDYMYQHIQQHKEKVKTVDELREVLMNLAKLGNEGFIIEARNIASQPDFQKCNGDCPAYDPMWGK